MIQPFFQDIIDLKGVEALAVFDNQNRLLDYYISSQYNPKTLPDLGETFLHIFGLLEHLQYPGSDEIVLPFDKGLIYAKSHPKLYLTIIAKPVVDAALLRLAVTVCLRGFENHRKSKKMLKKLPDNKFYQIKSITLDDVEKIMLENILEESDDQQQPT